MAGGPTGEPTEDLSGVTGVAAYRFNNLWKLQGRSGNFSLVDTEGQPVVNSLHLKTCEKCN